LGSPLLRIATTKARGKGVFAASDIPSRETVIRFGGRPRWIWDIPRGMWDHCLQVGYDRYVVPARGSFGWYVNHSCDPTCVMKGERSIATLREVKKGEEVTFDYSTNVGWVGFAMECRCGAENCRGTIRSYWGLDESWRRRYGKNVSPYLLQGRPQEPVRRSPPTA
jgi:SET domain-containing protein